MNVRQLIHELIEMPNLDAEIKVCVYEGSKDVDFIDIVDEDLVEINIK
jgi:hypothetical protein